MDRRSRQQSTSGFTLTELLVVVLMAAILAAIAGPSWLQYINNRRAGAVRDEILQTLRLAQSEALRSRRPQRVTINDGVDPPTITLNGQTTQLGNGNLRPGMVDVETTAPTIVFNATGALDPAMVPPIAIRVASPPTNQKKRCVVIESLLGATRTANSGELNCN